MTGDAMRDVLIVEDDRDCASALSELLECHDVRAHVAYSLDEARRLLVVLTPDLAVIDLTLDAEHGLELAHEMSASGNPHTRIVLVSGRPLTGAEQSALDAHGWSFALKPYDAEHLLQLAGSAP